MQHTCTHKHAKTRSHTHMVKHMHQHVCANRQEKPPHYNTHSSTRRKQHAHTVMHAPTHKQQCAHTNMRIIISMHQKSLTKNHATTFINMHAPTRTNHMHQRNCSHQHACIHQHVLTKQHAGTYTHSQTMNAPTHMLQHVQINKHTLTCTELHQRKKKTNMHPNTYCYACTNMHAQTCTHQLAEFCGKFSTCN